jgi:hypothetical protein
MAMHFFGLEITGDHARLILPAMGGALAFSGFVAGRWSRHRARVHFWREDLVASSIVIEMHGYCGSTRWRRYATHHHARQAFEPGELLLDP